MSSVVDSFYGVEDDFTHLVNEAIQIPLSVKFTEGSKNTSIEYKDAKYAIINVHLTLLLIFLDGKLHTVIELSEKIHMAIVCQEMAKTPPLESILLNIILQSKSIQRNGNYLTTFTLNNRRQMVAVDNTNFKFNQIIEKLTETGEGQFGLTVFEFNA